MKIAMRNNIVCKLSIALVLAFLVSFILPAYALNADNAKPGIIVISAKSDETLISSGKGEEIKVGSDGIITRDNREIAKFKVTQVEWGYSKISISDVAVGEKVNVGDKAKITKLPSENNGTKIQKKSSSKWFWALVAIGAVAALSHHSGGGGNGSTSNTGDNAIVLNSDKSSIAADGTSTTTITATVTDSNHAAVPDGTEVTFSTTSGTILPTKAKTVGGIATATLTAGTTVGTATISATVGSKSATINVNFVSSSAGSESITLAANPMTIQVFSGGGNQTQSTITATCRDSSGNLASSGTVTFTSSIGTVVGNAVISNGVATTTFQSNVTGSATVTAAWSKVTANITVQVTPGPPHSVIVSCTPSSIQCNGNSFATVTATVRDIAGNLVTDGTFVNFSVTPDINGGGNGTITPQSQTSNGIATAALYSKTASGSVSKAGTATVAVTVSAAGQPAGIPAAATDIGDHDTQVQFISLDVSQIHLGSNPINIRGWDVVGNTSAITAVVYDKNHNPVPDGTAVYFTADHGMIYGNAGTAGKVTVSTTTTGVATATLVSDASGNSTWNGLVNVTATSGNCTAPLQVIFSGWPSPSHCSATISTDTLSSVGGQASIVVKAFDINGNPVVDGTSIKATTSKGTLTATGEATTVGGYVLYTLTTSTDATSPTQTGPGTVTFMIDSGGPNPETGGQPVILTVPFTVQ